MVDALVSGASVERRAGSSPVLGTMTKLQVIELNYLHFSLKKYYYGFKISEPLSCSKLD